MDIDLKAQLIKDGYLPEQLPPFFTTEKLNKYYSELIAYIKKPNKGYYDCADFTIRKSNGSRRLMKVPNPARQLLLVQYILENKDFLERKFNENKSSLSNPFYYVSDEDYEFLFFDIPRIKDRNSSKVNSNFLHNFQEKLNASLGHQYCYKLDVANFYDSIYTHSIEWSIIGRNESKKGSGNGNIGRELDRIVRNTNSKETAGIPTGPFTSRIISELILCSIDNELSALSKQFGDIFKFRHYVDDYEFYFRNQSDIYIVMNKIIEIFNSHRLKINEQKTEIVSYPFHHLLDIRKEYDFYIDQYNANQDLRSLRLLFIKADELTKSDIKGAYKYLYKVISDKRKIDLSKDWNHIEPFIIGHLLVNPSLSQYIVEIILLYKDHLTEKLIQEVYFNLIISLRNHLHNEAHWLLWALIEVDYPFIIEEILELYRLSDNDFTKIMLIHTIYAHHYERDKEIEALMEESMSDLVDFDFESKHWLLIHEWMINEWMGFKQFQEKYNGNEFFQKMKELKISFIDVKQK